MKNIYPPFKSNYSRTFASLQCSLFVKLSLVFLLAVLLAGCKKIKEEQGLTGVCPEVVSTSPADTSINIGLNASINATFNESMNSSSINAATFTVYNGTVPQAGIISFSGIIATFTPASAFAPTTTYTATIKSGVKDPAGNAMIKDYVWTFTTGSGPDISAPEVLSTDPENLDIDVMPNKYISIIFNETMDSLSVVSNITVVNATSGGSVVNGTITYSGSTAVFVPSSNLPANSTFSVTISTGATDLAGTGMSSSYTFNFTTGEALELVSPTVISTDPVNLMDDVPMDKILTATFSEIMDPATIDEISFTVKNGNTPVIGVVTYTGNTATFTPTENLFSNTEYTATITTRAEDMSGNKLINNYVWEFTTIQPLVPPDLKSAILFGVFGGSAGITNQGLNTIINNGRIGTTAVSTSITGLHDAMTGAIYTETPLNKGAVSKGIFSAPPAPGTSTSFTEATNASLHATDAYNFISPASKPGGSDPGAGELGALTLAPGIYKSASGTFKISNGDLTLDAMGDPNAVWIFQMASALTVGIAGPTGARSVKLVNGASAANVYWYVGSMATINGAGGGTMSGTIIASSGVTFSTAGNTVQTILDGRALSLNASVTMVNTTVNVP